MIGRALFVSLVVCFLSLISYPAFSLTPQPIKVTDYIQVMKIIVKVTPGNNGQARYWWYKMKLLSLDGLTETLICGKYDMSTVLEQPATVDDESLLNYLSRNYSETPMSETDKVWCLQ